MTTTTSLEFAHMVRAVGAAMRERGWTPVPGFRSHHDRQAAAHLAFLDQNLPTASRAELLARYAIRAQMAQAHAALAQSIRAGALVDEARELRNLASGDNDIQVLVVS